MTANEIRLGVFLSAQHPAGVSPAAAVREHLEQVELARELGLSSVWAGQHFLSLPFVERRYSALAYTRIPSTEQR